MFAFMTPCRNYSWVNWITLWSTKIRPNCLLKGEPISFCLSLYCQLLKLGSGLPGTLCYESLVCNEANLVAEIVKKLLQRVLLIVHSDYEFKHLEQLGYWSTPRPQFPRYTKKVPRGECTLRKIWKSCDRISSNGLLPWYWFIPVAKKKCLGTSSWECEF